MITFVTFAPLVAALLIVLTPSGQVRVMRLLALFGSLLSLGGVVSMIWDFDSSSGLQFVEKVTWIPGLGVNYFVAVDGVSMLVLLLTALLAPVTVLASWGQKKREKAYFTLLSVQFTALYGTFTALNFFHWFIFWEGALVPAFFLIKLFGGGVRRHQAALKFFLFTALGSVFMLLGFVIVFLHSGLFDFPALAQLAGSGKLPSDLGALYPW
ncbi:MAG: proton-conducting transporter membrane subunit, partial [Opitutales bacterium]